MNHRRAFTIEIDQISESEWNEQLPRFSDASIYQSWAYGAVCWGSSQLSHLVLRNGDDVVSMSQVRVVRIPLMKAGIAYVRWGPVCCRAEADSDPVIRRSTLEALIQEYSVRRGLMLRLLPQTFVQDSDAVPLHQALTELGFINKSDVRPYHSFLVDLSHPEEVLRAGLSARWRRQLNIAERNDLEISVGRTVDEYRKFRELYGEMMARKQFHTTVDVNEFERIQQRLPDAQRMLTLLCQAGGKAVAGLVVSMVGDTSIYLLAATGDAGLDARGSYLLQWHAMRLLKQSGKRWYDLGGANEAVNPGVFTFKSGMGGTPVNHLGQFDRSSSRFCDWSVAFAERMRTAARRVGDRNKGTAVGQADAG